MLGCVPAEPNAVSPATEIRLVFPDRDALDFNIKRARPYRHTEENAGWRIFGKVALVNFVECLEALRAYTEYVDLHDVL